MNEAAVPVTTIGGIILLIVCSKRIRTKIASLASWLFGRVAAAAPENSSEQDQATTSGKNIPRSSKPTKKREPKKRHRKQNDCPQLSTSLPAPIVEETLNEAVSDPPLGSPEKSLKQKSSKNKATKAAKVVPSESLPPVEQKISKNPAGEEKKDYANSSKRVEDLHHKVYLEKNGDALVSNKKGKGVAKSSIIDHFKPQEKASSSEARESKKVCANISYASIVTNTAPIGFEAPLSEISVQEDESASFEAISKIGKGLGDLLHVIVDSEGELYEDTLPNGLNPQPEINDTTATGENNYFKGVDLVEKVVNSSIERRLEEQTILSNLEQAEADTEKAWKNTEGQNDISDPIDDQIQCLEDQLIAPSYVVGEIETVFTKKLETSVVRLEEREDQKIIDMATVRTLTLHSQAHEESKVCRIEKNTKFEFTIGASLLGKNIELYCNYPKATNGILEEFSRDCYTLLNWSLIEGCKNADGSSTFAQITPTIAGTFHYYITENESIETNSKKPNKLGSGYFIVNPVLKYGANEVLPLNCIQCQTVLSKHLGPLSTWENKIRVAKESGYNMVHFTPIQKLGQSRSAYSVLDYLKVNGAFSEENGQEVSFEDIGTLTGKMREEWKMLSVCDIVLNHTANESEWIKEHPEATYNCLNCPYLRPAYLLDAAFHQFSMDVKKGLYEDRGIPPQVSTEEHLSAIRYHFKEGVLKPLKIQEMFIVDLKEHLDEFLMRARKREPLSDSKKQLLPELKIIQDVQFTRLSSTVDLELALDKYNAYWPECYDEEARIRRCAKDFQNDLLELNRIAYDEVTADLDAAVENSISSIRYFRVQADGPQHTDITYNHPLVYRYFTDYKSPKSLAEAEETMCGENGRFLMAHNGWVMNADPLKNFADAGSKVYIRRELIAWGDSVKLRYGEKPADSPFLWNYMRQYVEQTVKIFDGIRLDNCHSTPLPVAEYLLDCARKIRPDLYVVAELFTNSDCTDNVFVNRLGITSLIREAMSAWDAHELGRLVHRYGGVPVGSFFNSQKLGSKVAPALFLDQTHDNPSPIEKRSVFDLLPSTGLVNMSECATGSNRGYDELVPHHIHVVDETRQYAEWSEDEELPSNGRYVNKSSGIIAAKRALNELHFKLGMEGFDQVYVNQVDADIVEVTRHQLQTHTSYVLVAFTSFGHPSDGDQRDIKRLSVEGVLDEIVLEAYLTHKDPSSRLKRFENFTKDPDWINGLTEYQLTIREHIQLGESEFFEATETKSTNLVELNYKNFIPGSVAVLKFSLPQETQDAISLIKNPPSLENIIQDLTLADLNRILFRCGDEERDDGFGFDTYDIPEYKATMYCGFFGIDHLLKNIANDSDLGHPLCSNLRNGNWLIEYTYNRLKVDDGTRPLGEWIEEYTKPFLFIPRYLVPCYFNFVHEQILSQLLNRSYQLMSDFVKQGTPFIQALALGSLQLVGYVQSARFPELSPNLASPKPPSRTNENAKIVQTCVTISAGLPHFCVGYMRNWGRDTFIALRGLLILTGRFEEARQHFLAYGACLRHGLIPNLLDGGVKPRFNCRDAIWWWLYSLKSYCEECPQGNAILSDVVSRIFPSDDSPPQPAGAVDQPLHDVIQEALNVHFQGLKFRERNAGREIDEHMADAGFNNQIGIHPETGFVYGGNQWNCGTWMDKMGSSELAGNRGKPATPRDGSAIELIGLSKACITWLMKLNDAGQYPYDGVQRTHKNGTVTKWTFREWSEKIQQNFEKKFWVSEDPNAEELRPDLVNKKNIYKDSFGATQPWADYQLRCNFPIAMVAAPELFNPQHAWAALEQAEKHLLGPLGMKTLDPDDWNYHGDYDNSNNSTDIRRAHGYNYHQGPEWVWPVGFFLRAKLIFAAQNGLLKETLAKTKQVLSNHFVEVEMLPWHGLPELTNRNGAYCPYSSRTQAWSMSCILEVVHDLEKIDCSGSGAN